MPLVVDYQKTQKTGVLIYNIDCRDQKERNNEADAVLAGKDPGTFYIRVSSRQNCLVLQFVRYDNEVLRKLIEPVTSSAAPGAWKVYDKKDVFPSLRELIDFYTKNKIVECNGFAVDPATAVCTLTQVLIKNGLAKFDFTTTKSNVADVSDVTVLPCEAGCEVAVVDETAGALVAIDKRNGYYGNLRTSYCELPEDPSHNLEDDISKLLELPVEFSEQSRFPADAVALIDYAVPYSNKTLNFKEGDKIVVERCIALDESSSSDCVLYGRLKYNRTKSGQFPRFAVKIS